MQHTKPLPYIRTLDALAKLIHVMLLSPHALGSVD